MGEVSVDLDGFRFQMSIPPSWQRMDVPGTLGAWLAPSPVDGFVANANLLHTQGGSARGEQLVEQVTDPLLSDLEDWRLVDVALEHDDDLRLVVAHRVGPHRVTLLQRVLVHDGGAVTLSLTVPDLALAATRDDWQLPLRSLRRQEVTG